MPISAPPPSWESIKSKPNTISGFGITDVNWQNLQSKPTTIAGFGITDEKCKAWVNFNGTGTPSIRASYNVSSITDNNTGDYWLNLSSGLVDANYAVSGIMGRAVTGDVNNRGYVYLNPLSVQESGRVRIAVTEQNVMNDPSYCCVSIFR